MPLLLLPPIYATGSRLSVAGGAAALFAAWLVATMRNSRIGAVGLGGWLIVLATAMAQDRALVPVSDELLERFIPVYDIVERHHIRVAAPAAVTEGPGSEIGRYTLVEQIGEVRLGHRAKCAAAAQLRLRCLALAREVDRAPLLGAQRLQGRLGAALRFDAVAQLGDLLDRRLDVLARSRARLLGRLPRLALLLRLPHLVDELAHRGNTTRLGLPRKPLI